ncbi:putative transcriptional regulatory protein C11D3.07c [Colletotrichum liriopes]|uniref:Transcriptional regulatory protein C11D3.07c n=1 Tax=Colletotrichum liriopes TaxID=708192 RepID=A0AA37GSG9_9PEZI|nr:putative transcriptional regulatory protein C11D3.07c [Colletotrichum liriopes]
MDAAANCDDGPEDSTPGPNTHLRAAIRCDRQHPCSQCASAKIDCILVDKKPREKRTRILVTSEYQLPDPIPFSEKKIDELDRRMGEVLSVMQDLKNDRHLSGCSHAFLSTPARADMSSMSSSKSSPSSHAIQPGSAAGSSAILGEGESSLAAHSAFASDFMQHVASASPLQCSRPEMRDTLDALSSVVATLREQTVAKEMAYPHARPIQRPGPSGYGLPPIQKVVDLIRIAKSFIYEFILTRNFSDICLQVYFSDSFSEMEFIIVNAGLHSLLEDYSHHVPVEEKEVYQGHARMCRANLETALSSLPLHIPTTMDAVTALLFGAWHAIELSKPYLAWALSAKASELCQTLSYHRIPDTDDSDDAKARKFLFWTNYFLDKCLSLRLGRASTIPDWDITTHRPSTTDTHKEAVMAYFVLWVESARCQGNIYEMLYSPEAIAQSDHVRQSRAQLLVNDLRMLDQAMQETNVGQSRFNFGTLCSSNLECQEKWIKVAKDNAGTDVMDFFAASDDTLRLSLLTLVHRAAPQPADATTTFSHSCAEAARAALHRHQDCLAIIDRSSEDFLPSYVHWTLLFTPFIPFIVIFCQVIETQDNADLDHLGAFVASIQPAAAASDAAAKLCRLFQVLYNVAARYAELSGPYNGHPETTEEMNMYLKLLGVPHGEEGNASEQHRQEFAHDLEGDFAHGACGDGTSTGEAQTGPIVMNPMMRMGNGAQLEEWFYRNQDLMQSFQTSADPFPMEE